MLLPILLSQPVGLFALGGRIVGRAKPHPFAYSGPAIRSGLRLFARRSRRWAASSPLGESGAPDLLGDPLLARFATRQAKNAWLLFSFSICGFSLRGLLFGFLPFGLSCVCSLGISCFMSAFASFTV